MGGRPNVTDDDVAVALVAIAAIRPAGERVALTRIVGMLFVPAGVVAAVPLPVVAASAAGAT